MTYKALKPIGPWAAGDIIGDLPQHQIEQLLSQGAIQQVKTENKLNTKGQKADGK